MKRIQQVTLALMVFASALVYSCDQPNDDKGSMDVKNSDGEGAIDSTRMPRIDTTQKIDSPQTSLFQKPSANVPGKEGL